MPSKIALIDNNEWHAEKPHNSICTVAPVCSHDLLKQEAPLEISMAAPLPGDVVIVSGLVTLKQSVS